ncbi:MAG: hypothetical protein HWD59_03790 [Coxiellaceae bacterium]|nr:MAG: hypothetical protein HWD59_03790 [Coxiellaceae bacterium]
MNASNKWLGNDTVAATPFREIILSFYDGMDLLFDPNHEKWIGLEKDQSIL